MRNDEEDRQHLIVQHDRLIGIELKAVSCSTSCGSPLRLSIDRNTQLPVIPDLITSSVGCASCRDLSDSTFINR